MNAWKAGKEEVRRTTDKTSTQVQSSTHIRDNRENGHPVENFLPGSDVAGLRCHRTSELSSELPGVHPHLDDVVDKCQQGCQGEGGNEQGDEAELDHLNKERPFLCALYCCFFFFS